MTALIFLLSFALCAGMIRFGLPYASLLAIAVPNARSSHVVPTPQSGGLFVFAAVFISAINIVAFDPNRLMPMAGILIPCLGLAVIGWFDDRRGLPVILRLLAFSCIALITALTGLFSTHFLLVAFFLVILINVTNFMDGIDGMVVVEFVPMLVMFAILSAIGHFNEMSGLLAISLAGALLGFFIFNMPKAKIFLGDSGSLVVGFMGGLFLLEFAERAGWMTALILPAYFFADACLTLLLRILNGERIWQAHRKHYYQQAFDSGQSNWSIIGRVIFCNMALCVIAYMTIGAPLQIAISALATSVVVVCLLMFSLARRSRPATMSKDAE